MRQLVLVGVLLGAASSPACDARTRFNVGAYVVESCEVSATLIRNDARCPALASRELRTGPPRQANVSSEGAVCGEATRTAPAAAGAREATTAAMRILLIRF